VKVSFGFLVVEGLTDSDIVYMCAIGVSQRMICPGEFICMEVILESVFLMQ
jgi:hypothetical protein